MDRLPDEVLVRLGKYMSPLDRMRASELSEGTKRCWNIEELRHLLPFQLPHYEKIINCLSERSYAVDVSVMGCGKTYSACAVAAALDLDMLVICPNNVQTNWQTVGGRVFGFGPKRLTVVNYEKLRRGARGLINVIVGPSAQHLENDAAAPATLMRPRKAFEVSDEWRDAVKRGVLLVLDESHAVKNASAQSACALALTSEIHRSFNVEKGRSRLLAMSATFMDKDEQQAPRFAKILGLYTGQLARQDIRTGYRVEGLEEFLDSLGLTGERRARILARVTPLNKNRIVAELFDELVIPRSFFAMPDPPIQAELDIANGFYEVSEESSRLIERGIAMLRRALSLLAQHMHRGPIGGGGAGGDEQPFEVLSAALRTVELGKIEILARQAEDVLRRYPTCKVVFAMNSIEGIDRIRDALSRYDPLVYRGDTRKRDRATFMEEFQSRSLARRVLVCNVVMCSQGMNMHDLHGDRPRFLFGVPGYRVIDMHQMGHRIYRVGTLSRATVRWVYARMHARESHLLDSIARKSTSLQKSSSRRVGTSQVPFPNEYREHFELD